MAEVDIFNPQVSVVAHGLEGKTIMIYGSNNTGKTFQSVRAKKPYVLACESGLGAQNNVHYNKISNWKDFTKAVKQFTSKNTVEKAKEMDVLTYLQNYEPNELVKVGNGTYSNMFVTHLGMDVFH